MEAPLGNLSVFYLAPSAHLMVMMQDSSRSSLMPHLVEMTDVGDAADAEVAPRHVGRHRQQAVPIQLPVLHLKKKDNWALLEYLRFASTAGNHPK